MSHGECLVTFEILCARTREFGARSILITMNPHYVCFCRTFGSKCLGASVLIFQGTNLFDPVIRPRRM